MIRAAIYARRSTEEHQAASLDVQLEEARRYIASKGWSLSPDHVFVDDAISRAEFKKRPALIGLLNSAGSNAFDVVVTRDETRLGGDTNRTCLLIQDLLDADVKLFYYFTNEEVRLDNAVAKFLVTARNFASELEREKISQRTHEHLKTKARAGFVTGGVIFGYDNLRITGEGAPRVEYRINEREADVVRRIFRLYADGEGIRGIARELNSLGIPSPRAGKRGTGSWAPSSLHAILRNERYTGHIAWGAREKTYRKGTKVRILRDEAEITHVEAPHLRIVDEALWTEVQATIAQRTKVHGPKGPRAPRLPRGLLTGMARCGECGGPISSRNGKLGTATVLYYHCKWHHDRGLTVCRNKTRRPVEAVDGAVVQWLREHVLRESVVAEVIIETKKRLRARFEPQVTDATPALEGEAKRLRTEVARLASALAVSDAPPQAIVALIGEKEAQLRAVESKLTTMRAEPALAARDIDSLDDAIRARLRGLQGMMARSLAQGRQVLETLLKDRLTVTVIETDDGPRYLLRGVASLGPILASESSSTPLFASPAGSASLGITLHGILQTEAAFLPLDIAV